MDQHEIDLLHMRRALELAARGEGFVEPNPMVGCVISHDAEVIGEGFHQRFGQSHAEVEALRAAGDRAAGATLYVTLEPCCHFGKTPPCTQAILASGVRRVVVAQQDPFAEVRGQGIAELQRAGLDVQLGVLADDAERLNAPYLKLIRAGRPWIIAKWAMTLDGRIATIAGESRWISGEASRAIVHRLRGRVDAVMVGRGTAAADDPLLTARPAGPRAALRVVVDTQASLSGESQLVRTAREVPVLVAVGAESAESNRSRLRQAGCEVLVCAGETHAARLGALLNELGTRRLTNVLVEGGGQLLGSLFDARAIDEVHVFITPKLVGGASAPSPIAGAGIAEMTASLQLESLCVEQVGADLYIHGRMRATVDAQNTKS